MMSSLITVQDKAFMKGDAKGNIIDANAAATRLLGLSVEEMKDDGWLMAIHPDERAEVLATWLASYRDGKPFGPMSVRYKHPKTGDITLVEAAATPVFSGFGEEKKVVSWYSVVVPVIDVQKEFPATSQNGGGF